MYTHYFSASLTEVHLFLCMICFASFISVQRLVYQLQIFSRHKLTGDSRYNELHNLCIINNYICGVFIYDFTSLAFSLGLGD